MKSVSRLLLVDQFGTIGGGQRILLSLLRPAQDVFHTVDMLAPPGPLEDAVRTQSGGRTAYHYCDEPRLTHGGKTLADIVATLSYMWRFRRHFRLLRTYDVIYVNGLRHLPYMLVFSLLVRTRIIYHVHLAHSRMERWLIRLASHWPGTVQIVVSSNFIARALGAGPKIRAIQNALGPPFARRRYTGRFGSTGWRAAVVGTLRPEKGQDIAMDAVRDRPITLYLIGKEGDGAEAWAKALKDRSQPNVIFHGVTDDVARCLDDLDIQFALVPSRWQEPFGLSAIEGMACSCLTLVSGTGGLGEIAADTGAIVSKDQHEIGAALDRLSAMPSAALDALARQQFEATQRSYAPERFEQEIRDLLHMAAKG